ncbi:unnamed protein product [Darwinula stevensoni]|uniref:Uncharacterized protein n=1 Tax=Darwinula stevensoni TaxID=69355 RepID=A0A7R9AAL7_9CRUS|nr:unnamed protein product [Darwinula stevensoni]CAG0898578.1 unnamed protein product [Darwinula stevensoni]
MRCFTFHPNVTLGAGGESTGYSLLMNIPPRDVENGTVFWTVFIHKDLGWASTYLRSTYTKIKIRPGTSTHVILSAKEVNQLDTKAYPCESREGYSNDECLETCLLREIIGWNRLSCQLPSMNLSLPECRNMTEIMSSLSTLLFFYNFPFTSNCPCQTPCQQIRYSVDVQPAENFTHDKRSLMEVLLPEKGSQVFIYFFEKTAEVLTESQAYDFIQMLGEFGGCLGLFLGISIVSVYESLDRYIRSVFARYADSRK